MSSQQIAILIDGSFFLKRLSKLVPADHCDTPENIARCVRKLCFNHVMRLKGGSGKLWQQHLYRVFFYDAQPYDGKAHHPISNRQIEFAKSDLAKARQALFDQLRKERKLALRLGKVNRDHDWMLSPRLTKTALKTREQLAPLQGLAQQLQQAADSSEPVQLQLSTEQAQQLLAARDFWENLQAGDVALGLRQKGVDMRNLSAQEVMKANPRTLRVDALAAEAAEMMETHRITSLLVVDAQGMLCGAINSNDLMRAKVI